MPERRQGRGSSNLIVGIVMLVVAVMALYFIFKSIVWVLGFLAPVLLLITLVINKDVVLDYVKGMFGRLKNDTLMGIAQLGVTFFLFPFVAAFLFAKAMLLRKVGKMSGTKKEEEFTEYEDLTEDDVLDLKDLEDIPQKQTRTASNNKYDDLFNE